MSATLTPAPTSAGRNAITGRAAWLEPGLVLLGCALLALGTRFEAFFLSAPHPDESLFLIMGREWLRGAVPYTTAWDHHPVGGPALFALAQLLFGQTFVALRLLTLGAVTVQGGLLYAVGRRLGGPVAGVIASVVYVVYSVHNEGLAAHRELFVAPLITLAVLLWISRPRAAGRLPGVRLFIIGLLLGAALQLKYLYIWDSLAVAGIITFDLAWRQPGRGLARRLLSSGLLLSAGPLLIAALLALYFAVTGNLALYLEANFRAGAAYTGSQVGGLRSLARLMVGQVRENILAWIGLLLLPFYLALVRHLHADERRNFARLGIWFALALAGVFFTGNLFRHYFLTLLPPLGLITGLVVAGSMRTVAGPDENVRRGLLVSLVLLPALLPGLYTPLTQNAAQVYRHIAAGQPWPTDTPAQVADTIRSRIAPGDAIFVADYEPVVYYLVDARLPTRYVFTPHMMDAAYERIAAFDQVAELEAILAQRPVYVIRLSPRNPDFNNRAAVARLDERLGRDYHLETTISGTSTTSGRPVQVELYRINP